MLDEVEVYCDLIICMCTAVWNAKEGTYCFFRQKELALNILNFYSKPSHLPQPDINFIEITMYPSFTKLKTSKQNC